MSKVTDQLERVPLFSDLSQRQLGRLGRHFRERLLEPGTSVVQEGKMSGTRDFARDNPDVTWKLLQHVVTVLSAGRS